MKKFMSDDFMLNTGTAVSLYQKYADMRKVPVIDYHCHISPQEIYEDRRFDNLTQVWLGGDHYKWRQLRTCGVPERYITGDASDYEKFGKWAQIMPKLIGNPLYHWSHLELKYYFGYEGNLNPDTCKEVWELVNSKLRTPEFSARGLIKQSNVKLICTTDDPIDSLKWHEKLAADESFETVVLPAWRPDKAMYIEKPDYAEYIAKLGEVASVNITSFEGLKEALRIRMEYFKSHGCRIADHGLAYVMYEPCNDSDADVIFKKALSGQALTDIEELKFKTAFMLFVSREYKRLDWTSQLHYGVRRDNNTRMFECLGPDTGFDCISDYTPCVQLSEFLNDLAKTKELPRTIIYSLNPIDNAAIGTVIGCFQGEAGNQLQQGSAWWFNDHVCGMQEQLKSLAALSTLGNFVGMLTDSRSFLSYTRHDYFRRILCDYIGGMVERGEYPDDEKLLEQLIRGISYDNAVRYFGFEKILAGGHIDE